MSDFRLHAWNVKKDKLHHIPPFLLRGRTHNLIKNNNLTEKKKRITCSIPKKLRTPSVLGEDFKGEAEF